MMAPIARDDAVHCGSLLFIDCGPPQPPDTRDGNAEQRTNAARKPEIGPARSQGLPRRSAKSSTAGNKP
jgi:hypothetical protein